MASDTSPPTLDVEERRADMKMLVKLIMIGDDTACRDLTRRIDAACNALRASREEIARLREALEHIAQYARGR